VVTVALLGSSSCGKTALSRRFSEGAFSNEYHATIGAMFFSKKMMIKNDVVKLNIFDTSGQERYFVLNAKLHTEVDVVAIAYDITNLESLQTLKMWVNEFKQHDLLMCVVGTKADLESIRAVSKTEVSDFAESETNVFYLGETSAKTGEDVDKFFCELVKCYVNGVLKGKTY